MAAHYQKKVARQRTTVSIPLLNKEIADCYRILADLGIDPVGRPYSAVVVHIVRSVILTYNTKGKLAPLSDEDVELLLEKVRARKSNLEPVNLSLESLKETAEEIEQEPAISPLEEMEKQFTKSQESASSPLDIFNEDV